MLDGVAEAWTSFWDFLRMFARANPFSIFELVAIPMTEAVDWIAQAQLQLLTKPNGFQALHTAGYRTIFDLVRLLKTPQSAEVFRDLCNWATAPGYDQIAAITADSAIAGLWRSARPWKTTRRERPPSQMPLGQISKKTVSPSPCSLISMCQVASPIGRASSVPRRAGCSIDISNGSVLFNASPAK